MPLPPDNPEVTPPVLKRAETRVAIFSGANPMRDRFEAMMRVQAVTETTMEPFLQAAGCLRSPATVQCCSCVRVATARREFQPWTLSGALPADKPRSPFLDQVVRDLQDQLLQLRFGKNLCCQVGCVRTTGRRLLSAARTSGPPPQQLHQRIRPGTAGIGDRVPKRRW